MEARIREDIRRYVVSNWLNGDSRGFDDDTDLQEAGILDSFSTLALTAFLDETFKIRIEPANVNATTFRSVSTLTELVLGKLVTATTPAD